LEVEGARAPMLHSRRRQCRSAFQSINR